VANLQRPTRGKERGVHRKSAEEHWVGSSSPEARKGKKNCIPALPAKSPIKSSKEGHAREKRGLGATSIFSSAWRKKKGRSRAN